MTTDPIAIAKRFLELRQPLFKFLGLGAREQQINDVVANLLKLFEWNADMDAAPRDGRQIIIEGPQGDLVLVKWAKYNGAWGWLDSDADWHEPDRFYLPPPPPPQGDE